MSDIEITEDSNTVSVNPGETVTITVPGETVIETAPGEITVQDADAATVVVSDPGAVVVQEPQATIIEVGIEGPQGPQGLPGSGGGTSDHNALQNLTVGDPHPQYPARSDIETIQGLWTFTAPLVIQSMSTYTPPANSVSLQTVISGPNIILRMISSTGATCDICTLVNGAVAHVNKLALNWIE